MHICTSDREKIDVSSLPVFGDDKPSCTNGIYSWDDKHMLTYDNFFGDLVIRHRYDNIFK